MAYDYTCPRCEALPSRACRKLNTTGPTGFLRVPHRERRELSDEGVNGNPIRRR